MTIKKRVKTWILVFFILASCLALTEEVKAGGGSVIINNRTSENVTILTLRIDAFGYRSWKKISVIPPMQHIILPDVPVYTEFGVKVGNNSRPPFKVIYTSEKQLFVYDVNP